MQATINNKALQAVLLVALILGGIILSSFLTFALLAAFGLDVYVIENMGKGFWENLTLIKCIQILTSVLVFVFPAIAFAAIIYKKPAQYLQLTTKTSSNQWLTGTLLTAGIILFSFPFMAYVLQWNMALELPEAFSEMENWMRLQEESMKELTLAFLQMESIGSLLFTLILVAVAPAISEELLFRGVIQQWFGSFMNVHVAILTASILFSAMHMQFLGFFPRLFIGMYLGYIFYWTGNLWFPIIGHFINNGIQVLAVYFGALDIEAAANAPETQIPIWGALLSLITITIFGLAIKRYFQNNPTDKLINENYFK